MTVRAAGKGVTIVHRLEASASPCLPRPSLPGDAETPTAPRRSKSSPSTTTETHRIACSWRRGALNPPARVSRRAVADPHASG